MPKRRSYAQWLDEVDTLAEKAGLPYASTYVSNNFLRSAYTGGDSPSTIAREIIEIHRRPNMIRSRREKPFYVVYVFARGEYGDTEDFSTKREAIHQAKRDVRHSVHPADISIVQKSDEGLVFATWRISDKRFGESDDPKTIRAEMCSRGM